MINLIKADKYDIYIGLKDKDTYEEYISINEFKNILDKYCRSNNVAFSLVTLRGGYEHSKGYVVENSLKVELINAPYDTVLDLAKWLKEKINTDTVMITKEETQIEYR